MTPHIDDMLVVYRSPRGYPGEYVVIRHECTATGNVPRELVARGKTLEDVRELIPPWLECFGRDPDDDPNIVEVWF